MLAIERYIVTHKNISYNTRLRYIDFNTTGSGILKM